MLARLKNIKVDSETVTILLISLGLPLIAYMYFSVREAVSLFIITQIVLGLIRIRYS